MIDDGYPRDLVMTAAIFGVAAFVWSGWAQGCCRAACCGVSCWRCWASRAPLAAGFAIPLAVRHWSTATAIRFEGPAWVAYLVVVAIEVVACIGLAVWASRSGRSDLIAPLILAVVGIHFIPLAFVFGQPIMAWTGVALAVVAVVAAVIPSSDTPRSFGAASSGRRCSCSRRCRAWSSAARPSRHDRPCRRAASARAAEIDAMLARLDDADAAVRA